MSYFSSVRRTFAWLRSSGITSEALSSLFIVAIGVIWASNAPTPAEAVVFFIGLLLIIYLPGRFVVALLSLKGGPGEPLLLSLLAGMVSSSAIYGLLAAFGQRKWSFFFLAVLAIAGVAAVFRTRRPNAPKNISASPPDSRYWPGFLALYLAVLLVLVFSGYFNAFEPAQDGGALVANFPDDGLFHAGIVHEVLRSVPPHSTLISGYELNYSYFTDLLIALFHDLLGIEVISLVYVLFPLFFFGLLLLSIYVAGSVISGSAVAGLLCCFLVLFGGGTFNVIPGILFLGWEGGRWELAFHASTMVPLFFINPMVPGLAVFYGALLCLYRSFRSSALGWSVIAGILTAALVQYKIFGTAVIIAGLIGTAALHLIRRRQLPPLAPFLTAIAFPLPFIYYHAVMKADITQVVARFQPALPLDISLNYLGLKDLAGVIRDQFTGFRPGIEEVLLAAVLIPSHILGSLGIRVFALASLIKPVFSLRPKDTMQVFLGCSFLAGLLLTYLVSITPRDFPGAYNNSVWFYAFSLHIATISVSQIIPVFLSRGRRRLRYLLLLVGLVAGLLSSAQFIFWSDKKKTVTRVSPSVVKAIDHLKKQTSQESLILLDPSGEKGSEDSAIITGLAGRRVMLSGSHLTIYQAPAREIEARRKSILKFFSDPCGNALVIKTHGVDYVWERIGSSGGDWGERLNCPDFSIEKAFAGNEISIYKVLR